MTNDTSLKGNSKLSLKKLFFYFDGILFLLLFFVIIAIQVTDFYLGKNRTFCFDLGSNTSSSSHFNILLEAGLVQHGYAHFLGNVNVAELTTGSAGRTLHNFISNVVAELGLVGLALVLTVLLLRFATLIKNIKQAPINLEGFGIVVINFWIVFIFIFLFYFLIFIRQYLCR